MRFSEAEGHRVLSTSTATTVGKVGALLVDPVERAVVALHLKKTPGDADTLLWPAMTAFGRDAVTVSGDEVFTTAEGRVAELGGKAATLVGKRVLDEGGDELGKVQDVEFDAGSGAITGLLTADDELDGARLLGVGSYAVVVRRA